MPARPSHPIERFRAPAGIHAGSPLKDLLGRTAVRLIGESFAAVMPDFDQPAFVSEACRGLGGLELKPRAAHIAAALARRLDRDQARAASQLVASLGPPLVATSGMGLRPFFYLPHSAWLHGHCRDWAAGMDACRALTRRFTAEFAIRPFLIREPARTLAQLARWTADPDPHVRRLVSEGARPRLPWAERLPALVADPAPALPLLDALVDDPELYVRRSVANHVGDIAKDHLDIATALCADWLRRATPTRRWVVRHALRHPARKGLADALSLRRAAGG